MIKVILLLIVVLIIGGVVFYAYYGGFIYPHISIITAGGKKISDPVFSINKISGN